MIALVLTVSLLARILVIVLDFFTVDFHRERTKLANSNNYKYLSRSWKEENALRLFSYGLDCLRFIRDLLLETVNHKFQPKGIFMGPEPSLMNIEEKAD